GITSHAALIPLGAIIQVAGGQPNIAMPRTIHAGNGEVTVEGQQPSVATPVVVNADSAEVAVGGQQANVATSTHATYAPQAAAITVTGHQPQLEATANLE